jgi:lysyl-tRNA synthetase class I
MVNYVKHEVIVTEEILDYVKGEIDFDFNKIIPTPPHIYQGNLGHSEEEEYGKNNCWYEWRIFNWGTKWNAIDVKIKGYVVTFETAWKSPDSIFRCLSKIFPDEIITVKYADEDIGFNCDYVIYKNGLRTRIEIENEKLFAKELWKR